MVLIFSLRNQWHLCSPHELPASSPKDHKPSFYHYFWLSLSVQSSQSSLTACLFTTWGWPVSISFIFPSWRMSSLPAFLCPLGWPPKWLSQSGSWTGQNLPSGDAIIWQFWWCFLLFWELNTVILWMLWSRRPLTTHQSFCTDKQMFQGHTFFSWLHHQLCKEVSFTDSRNILDYFLFAVLYLQEMSGKSKSSMRIRARNGETSPSCLQNISSASLSWLGGL